MTARESDTGRGTDPGTESADEPAADRTAEANGILARYVETATERRLVFDAESSPAGRATAAIAQNREGYAMLKVRPTPDGDELERYYGFDMALDHVAEVLGVSPTALPVPEAAADMGM